MTDSVGTFRALHHGPRLLCLANAWDPGSARLMESLGAAAVATTSAGVAWALGYPDGGVMPAEAAIAVAQRIAGVLTVPLTVDFEDGYSADPAVVAGYVRRLADSGVAGINLEDGADAPEVAAAKLEAIKAAGVDIFVNLRTDVYLRGLAPEGAAVAEVLARAKTYRDAGADGLFVPGLCVPAEIREVVAETGLPLNVMEWPGLPPAGDLAELGVRRLSAGSAIAQSAWGLVRELAEAFLAGEPGPAVARAMDYGELQQLLGSGRD
jgi:2-methylisocitrate lyase-like PEP mutase family enzyme